MCKKWFFLVFFVATKSLFAANAPIQRVDVVNLLGSLGATQTAVVLSFSVGAIPCYTTTLLFQGALTVWAGTGQTCSAPITSMSITPVASISGLMYYDTPVYPEDINGTQYFTLLTIRQGSSPVFDPSNGALLMAGSIQTVIEAH